MFSTMMTRLGDSSESCLDRLSSSSWQVSHTHLVIFAHTTPNTVTLSTRLYFFLCWSRSDLLRILDIFTSVSVPFTLSPSEFRVLVLVRFPALETLVEQCVIKVRAHEDPYKRNTERVVKRMQAWPELGCFQLKTAARS